MTEPKPGHQEPESATRKHVEDIDTLRALTHPLRVRLLGSLRLDGPATATELARRFGESSGATSYHLRQLARYGFVTDDSAQPSRRERRWRAAHQFTVWTDADFVHDPAGREAVGWMHRRQLRNQQELVERFLAEAQDWSTDWVGATDQSDEVLRLTPASLTELKDRVHALFEEYRGRQADAEDGERVALYFAAYPFRGTLW